MPQVVTLCVQCCASTSDADGYTYDILWMPRRASCSMLPYLYYGVQPVSWSCVLPCRILISVVWVWICTSVYARTLHTQHTHKTTSQNSFGSVLTRHLSAYFAPLHVLCTNNNAFSHHMKLASQSLAHNIFRAMATQRLLRLPLIVLSRLRTWQRASLSVYAAAVSRKPTS